MAFLEPRIPEDWVRVTDKKLSDLVQMTGELATFDEDEVPVYWDPDTEGYIFLHKEEFGGVEMMAAYRVARQPNDNQADVDLAKSDDPMARMGQGFCPPFNPHTYEVEPGIVCMQDQEVVMRDGTKIYADIYRPAGDDVKCPTIVSWSWFGKRPGDGMSEWQIMGVPPQTVSKCAKFESPDPLYWCHYGYAVANVDVRGAGHSEGSVHIFTHQDREDGYDFVEWVAQQPWSNGKVGMAGNSGVAMHQWGIASLPPPHLACIAPWESTTDLYRESFFEGGVPALSFNKFIAAQVTGPNGVDDQVAMAKMYPDMNPIGRTSAPTSRRSSCPCTRRLAGRTSICRAPSTPTTAAAWPIKRTEYRKLYLDASQTLESVETDHVQTFVAAPEPTETEAVTKYNPVNEEVRFEWVLPEDTEITGHMTLHLWLSCEGWDDMDLFINIQKAAADGTWVPWLTLDELHPGAWGKCRVSRRELDKKLTRAHRPVLKNTSSQKLAEGEIVPVDIAIVPTARVYHKGERFRIQIAGRYIREGWFEPLSWDEEAKGTHVIHTGGQYDSWIEIPVIPPRYQAGEYIHR